MKVTKLLALGLLFASSSIYANPGKEMMADANCLTCHASPPTAQPASIAFTNPFSAAGSKIETKADVAKWVRLCDAQLNVGWFPDEVEEVANYLNDEFYKLK